MKTLMAAVVVAAATIIGSGAAQANEATKAPEPGTWEYQWAMETGTLPSTGSAKPQNESRLAGEPVPTVEIGGLVYRVGIDTN
jgi:hypothetical protein